MVLLRNGKPTKLAEVSNSTRFGDSIRSYVLSSYYLIATGQKRSVPSPVALCLRLSKSRATIAAFRLATGISDRPRPPLCVSRLAWSLRAAGCAPGQAAPMADAVSDAAAVRASPANVSS